MGGGPHPGEAFKMKCDSADDRTAMFSGHGSALTLHSGSEQIEYFKVGKEYAIVFQPTEE